METHPRRVEDQPQARTPDLVNGPRRLEDADVVALVTEFDCSRTVETGSDLGASALAIARVHEQRGTGEHTVISAHPPSPLLAGTTDGVRQAALLQRVNFITTMPEVALAELLREGFDADFALIHGPKRFEHTFMEFLYLDRLLVTGGIMVLAGAAERSVDAVREFAGRAHAYELRSPPGAELAVLRKPGRWRRQPTLFPASWGLSDDDHAQASDRAPENGASGVTPLQAIGITNSTPLKSSSARDLHLAQERAGELEARLVELGASLVGAEQRAAELLRVRSQLRELELELRRSQEQQERAEHWLADLKASSSWRLTAPLRVVKTRARALTGR